ncbi:hydrogenase [Sulfurimonas sp.]|uniref:NADH-quinone oxidoreductase subunit B family protein n=1 Tax=Sulfurimonas sp. TaxID=2022749 RepID=UPI003D0DDFB0
MSKSTVVWLSAISCNGNAHSFLNYPNLQQFLENFEFTYHPVLESSYTLKDLVCEDVPCDILIIEGAIATEFERFNTSIKTLINKYAKVAQKVVTVGTCATFGGLFAQSQKNATGLHFKKAEPINYYSSFFHKTISLPGCPIQPEVLATALYSIKNSFSLHLDQYLRPKEFYGFTVHNGCVRNEYFEYKVDNYTYGSLEGCMYYDHGCQAPYTHNSCNKILWNEVNSKTREGHPCVGCSEPTFPKMNLFATKKNMGIPEFLPLGVPKRAYLGVAGVAKAFKIERFYKRILDD